MAGTAQENRLIKIEKKCEKSSQFLSQKKRFQKPLKTFHGFIDSSRWSIHLFTAKIGWVTFMYSFKWQMFDRPKNNGKTAALLIKHFTSVTGDVQSSIY